MGNRHSEDEVKENTMAEELKKKTNYWEFYLKREWSYMTGAVLLPVFATALVLVTGMPWGVTSAFAIWGGKFLELIGVNADSWKIFNGTLAKYNVWTSQVSMTDIGIVLGALLSVLLAASFKIKKIKNMKQVWAAIIGGTLMGIGARLSLGCNIGALFSGVPAFSLHGWVFFLFIFLGATLGSTMLKKWFM